MRGYFLSIDLKDRHRGADFDVAVHAYTYLSVRPHLPLKGCGLHAAWQRTFGSYLVVERSVYNPSLAQTIGIKYLPTAGKSGK